MLSTSLFADRLLLTIFKQRKYFYLHTSGNDIPGSRQVKSELDKIH